MHKRKKKRKNARACISVDLLPHRVFDRIVEKYQGNKYVRSFTCWNQLLVMMFAQLIGCGSLRELILFCTAHKAKTKWLGFGDISVSRSNLSKANQQRDDNILFDQRIRLTTYMAKKRYPAELRRIGFYKYRRTFVYLTNNWEICAKDMALLYKYRWQVELFFKWLKQHLQIKKFWGTSENAVRIQSTRLLAHIVWSPPRNMITDWIGACLMSCV